MYNDDKKAITIIDKVVEYTEENNEIGLKNYAIKSSNYGTFELKGSAFGIAFFNDEIEIEEGQDITNLLSLSLDKSNFIVSNNSKDNEIEDLKEKVKSLEFLINELISDRK